MLQRRAGACNAHMKDDLERKLSIMVCAGDLTLKGAQHKIATDRRAAYKKWIKGKGCGGTVTTWEAQMRLKLERDDGARGRVVSMAYLTKPPASMSEPSVLTRCPVGATRATPQGPFDCSTPSTSASSTRTWNALVKGVEVVLHAEGEGRKERQVASEPHARGEGEAG